MNTNLRHLYELTVQSKSFNKNKRWAYDFDEYYVEIFTELMLKDIDKIIDTMYDSVSLEQKEFLLLLKKQIDEYFYGGNNG